MDIPVTFNFLGTTMKVALYVIIITCSLYLCFQIRKLNFLFKARKIAGRRLIFQELIPAVILLAFIYLFASAIKNNFIGIEVRTGVLTLNYGWPCKDLIFKDEDGIEVKIVQYKKRSKRVHIVVSAHDHVYTSETMFREKAENVVQAISSRIKVHYE